MRRGDLIFISEPNASQPPPAEGLPAPKKQKTKAAAAAAAAASPAPDSEFGKQEPTRTNENKVPAEPHVLSLAAGPQMMYSVEAAAAVGFTLEEYHRLLALGGISKHLRGINIQWPWARLILDGLKTVEARKWEPTGYPLNEDLWMIETPFKGPVSCIGVYGKLTKKRGYPTSVARIIGIVRFGSSFQYTDLAHWRDDECSVAPKTD